jgi:DNA-binding transcriptional ArsR family regulator
MATKANIIIHPIRMRILAELGARQCTTRQLAAALHDVPQVSVYKHINTLIKHGIVEVISEQPIRGTMERTLAVAAGQGRLSAEDFAKATTDDHKAYFMTYITSFVQAFNTYVEGKTTPEILEGGLVYNQIIAYANAAEIEDLRRKFTELLQPLFNNEPTADRKRLTLGAMIIPEGKRK